MPDSPVLFDVGTIALAHAECPVSGPALEHVRRAVSGEVPAVVPCEAVVGAHHVLHNVYRMPNERASGFMKNFLTAGKIHWYGEIDPETTRRGLKLSGRHNIEGWDGYYAEVALETGVDTVVALDDDFERVDGLTVRPVLSDLEHDRLDEYLDQIAS